MICGNCGKEITPGASVCPFCGRPVRDPAAQKDPEPRGKRSKAWLVLILAALLLIGLLTALILSKSRKKAEAPAAEAASAPAVQSDPGQAVDSEAFFRQNAAIRSVWSARTSDAVKTEAEATAFLRERGFESSVPQSEYSIEGEYSDARDISAGSEEKHPIYQTYYTSSGGELWTVFVIDGSIVAYPVTYNVQAGAEVQLIISESEEIISYDSQENTFFKTIPNADALTVKVVDRIDADTLDRLTAEEIDLL